MLFNDNPDSDDFRRVYLIIIHGPTSYTPSEPDHEGNVSITLPAGTAAADVYTGTVDTDKKYNVGDTFTVELKSGYKFGTISGATLGGDGKTFTVTGATVSITIEKDTNAITVTDYVASGAEVSNNVAFGATVYTANVESMVDKTAGTISPIFAIDQTKTVWKDGGKEYKSWVPADARATVSFNVYGEINGKDELLVNGKTVAGASLAVTSTALSNPLIKMTNTFKIEVTKVVWDKVGVVYEVANRPYNIKGLIAFTDDTPTSLTVATVNAIPANNSIFDVKVKVGEGEGNVTGGGFEISAMAGISQRPQFTAATDVTATNGNEKANIKQNSTTAGILTGERPVVVTIDATKLTTTAARFTLTGLTDRKSTRLNSSH